MASEKFNFDLSHSNVGFSVRHLMVSKVHGRFTKWDGSLEFDEQNPAATKVDVTIDVASIDTRDEKRDAHLKSADFFDVEKFKALTFKSTSVAKGGDGFTMKGDLTIHGVTKPVELEVEYAGRVKDPWGGERVGFAAKTSINRKDFGLTWNVGLEAGGVLVGEKVEISLEIEAMKAKA